LLLSALFFTAAFITVAALIWASLELFRDRENPLEDRLEELQAHALVSTTRAARRKSGGGFFNTLL
jgi:hypothetical protein